MSTMDRSAQRVALVCAALLASGCTAGTGPGGSESSTTAATSSSAPVAEGTLIEPTGSRSTDPLEAGTYYVDDPFPVRVFFDLPQDWVVWGYSYVGSFVGTGVDDETGRGMSLEIVDNVVADPCDPGAELLDPPAGPSVDDLVAALSDLEGFEATSPVDIEISGFEGRQFELTAPDVGAECELRTWHTTTRTNGVGAGEVNRIRILNVDGVRLVIAAAHFEPISDEAMAEFDAILDSIRIET